MTLTGFTAFYGLERLADRSSPRTEHAATGATSGSAAHDDPGVGIYRLHLGSFLVYNALITYTMALRLRTGIAFAALFTIAMGLHFVLTDRGLEEHYPHRFRRSGRTLLAGALLVGWLLSALFAPSSTLLEVSAELNDRSRKTLGWITPTEAMQRLLSDAVSPVVATTA